MKQSFSREQRRRILLEHRVVYPADELCAKWGISRGELRQWKAEFDFEHFLGDFRDWVLAALYAGIGDVDKIIDFLDSLNHCRYDPEEVLATLRDLQREGLARPSGSGWVYEPSRSAGDSPYIF